MFNYLLYGDKKNKFRSTPSFTSAHFSDEILGQVKKNWRPTPTNTQALARKSSNVCG